METVVPGFLDVAPHVPGPILIVPHREKGAMGLKHLTSLVHIHVGGVTDVVTGSFQPSDHVVFPPTEKWPRSGGIGRILVEGNGIGAIEGNGDGPTLRTVVVVERGAAPIVVRLKRRDAGLHEIRRGRSEERRVG